MHKFILPSPHVLFMVESRELKINGKKNEYAHQLLDGNDIELSIPDNHSHMQITTSFA